MKKYFFQVILLVVAVEIFVLLSPVYIILSGGNFKLNTWLILLVVFPSVFFVGFTDNTFNFDTTSTQLSLEVTNKPSPQFAPASLIIHSSFLLSVFAI